MNCQHCERTITNKGSLAAHEATCSKNPNRTKHVRSTAAGRQKGSAAWNKGISMGRHARWDEKFSLESVLTEDSTYPRHCVKRRILEEKLLPYQCSICDSGPVWRGEPMPLILDHINGINNDHRIENLRFVCSNCDSQLPTYKSRNRRK